MPSQQGCALPDYLLGKPGLSGELIVDPATWNEFFMSEVRSHSFRLPLCASAMYFWTHGFQLRYAGGVDDNTHAAL